MLDGYIIEHLKKRRDQEDEERPQLPLEIPTNEDAPHPQGDEEKPKDEPERGVAIIHIESDPD